MNMSSPIAPRLRRRPGPIALVLLVFGALSGNAVALCTVSSPDQVAFHTDSDFGGSCVLRSLGDYPSSALIGLPEDSISSIVVGRNVQTYVCADSYFEGSCELITAGDASLGNNLIGHDRISSVKVQRRGSSTTCTPGADQVGFFRDANFSGPCTLKTRGDFPLPDAFGLRGDSISSLRVGANVQAVLCRDTQLLGDCQAFTADQGSLAGMRVGSDTASSVRVMGRSEVDCPPGVGQAAFFQHQGFLKPCSVRNMDDYFTAQSLGIAEDSASSVRVAANTQAVVCSDSSFGGRCIVLSSDTANLATTQIGTDTLSSARVQPAGTTECLPGPGQVSLYKHSDDVAPCVVLNRGEYPTASAMSFENDAASSIRIGIGAQAEVCIGSDYSDNCILFTGSESNLGDTEIGHDSTSSIRVQSLGTQDCVPDAGQVAVYEHSNHLYPCAIRSSGDYANAAAFGIANNSMSSIRIGAGVQACACTASDFREVCEAFTTDDSNFGNNTVGHDTVSSLRVQPVGAACRPVPPVGVKTLAVQNCNIDRRVVYVWLHDLGSGLYEQKATLSSLYNAPGSCPEIATQLRIDLVSGRTVQLLAIDPSLSSCSGNDPTIGGCRRLSSGAITGDSNGTVLSFKVE